MPQLDRILAELKETNRRADESLRAGCKGADCADQHLGLSLRPGAKVYDVVTGQEGTILGGTAENTLIQPARGGKG